MDVHATTPAPFPLYQMIRVFLGCYVLAVPFGPYTHAHVRAFVRQPPAHGRAHVRCSNMHIVRPAAPSLSPSPVLHPTSPVLTDDLSYYALIFVPLLTFGFWGIDFVTRQLENPYGTDENDLDIGMIVADVFASIDDDFNLHHSYQSTNPIRKGGIANDKTPLV